MEIHVRFLLPILFFLLFVPMMASAQEYEVIVFEDYDKTYYIDGDTLTVEKDLIMRNTGNNPIIPGEVHFSMYEVRGSNRVPSEIRDVTAQDNTRELDTSVEKHDDYSDLIIHIWNPLLPDFEYPISISYEMDFNPTGILFHEMLFPVEETTIPIRDSTTRLVMPNRYRVTYSPDASISSDGMRRTIEWSGDSDLMLEYTRLPLPQMPFRMVSVFWLTVLMILGGIFIFLNSRRSDRSGKRR